MSRCSQTPNKTNVPQHTFGVRQVPRGKGNVLQFKPICVGTMHTFEKEKAQKGGGGGRGESNTKIPRFDGNNTGCCSDKGVVCACPKKTQAATIASRMH